MRNDWLCLTGGILLGGGVTGLTLYNTTIAKNEAKIKELGETNTTKDDKINKLLNLTLDTQKRTPLMIAANHLYLDGVEYLLDNGANVNSVDKQHNTTLMLALALADRKRQLNREFDIVQDIDVLRIKIAKLLIDKGANVDIQNNDKDTALICAARNNNTEIAKLLIDKGANVNLETYDKDTALICAARNKEKNTEIAKLLIAKGANVNAKNISGGYTALMMSIYSSNDALVIILIDNEASLNVNNQLGQNALWYVTDQEHPGLTKIHLETIDYLKSKGAKHSINLP